MRNRDVVWTQMVSHLDHGNLLVSAKSFEDPRVRFFEDEAAQRVAMSLVTLCRRQCLASRVLCTRSVWRADAPARL